MSKRVLAKNLLSVGSIQVANYLFPLITVPLVSRVIGAEKFGVINFASAYIAYFIMFIGYGFDLTATRKVARNPNDAENRNKVFSETLYAQGMLFFISIVVFCISLIYVPELKKELTVSIFTFLVCIGTVMTQNWLFQAMQDLPKVAILNLISKILFTIFILLTVRQKSDYIWQPLAVSVSTIIIALCSFLWSIKKYKLRLTPIPFGSIWRNLWAEKTYFLSTIVVNLYTTTNIVLLGVFRNPVEVGYYSAGQRLLAIFQSIITLVLAQAFFPYISKAFGESTEKGLTIVQKLMPFVMTLTAVAAICMFILSPWIIQILYGKQFLPAIPVFRILAWTPLVVAFSMLTGLNVMLNLNMDKSFLAITCWGALFSLVFNFVIVRHYGYIASAYALLASETFVAILFFLTLRKKGVYVLNRSYFGRSYFSEVAGLLRNALIQKMK